MDYSQQNNQTNDRQSVTTRGASYKNGMCQYPMALEVGYSDDLFTLTFTPPLPDQERVQGQRLFDYKNQIRTGMMRDKAHLLYRAYEKFIVPAMETVQPKFVGVKIASGKHVIGLDTGVGLFKDGTCHPCVILIRNVNPEGLSDDVLMYEFKKGDVIIDYNPATGKTSETVSLDGEFEEFVEDLKAFQYGSSKAFVHANRQVENRYKTIVTDHLKAIAQKAGVVVTGSYTNNNNSGTNPYKGQSIFDVNAGATGSDDGLPFDDNSMPAPSATISDMDQLAAELGM